MTTLINLHNVIVQIERGLLNMTRVQQCLLVVCVSIFVIFGNSAFATKIQNVEGNLQATVLVSTKKITAQVDELSLIHI